MAVYKDITLLRFHSVGEPLYWQNLSEAIRYARKKEVSSWIFTSAVNVCPELYRELIENVSIVEVSVNSTEAEDYRLTKGTNAFKLVEENIIYMSKMRKDNRLVVSRVQSSCKEQDDAFVEFWKKSGLVDDAFIRSFHNYNDILQTEGTINKSLMQPCLVHFARFNIDTDGMAVVCFNELFRYPRDKHIELGNVQTTAICEIWNGEMLERIRTASLCGNYSELQDLYCPKCRFCQPLNTKRETSESQILKLKEKIRDQTI
jgi:MoaA/NifB/PqqE/SkfB family radical SAM enzyme